LFGQVTQEGIGRALPNRKTIVLSNDLSYNNDDENIEICRDINIIIDKYRNNPDEDIIISGGATIYKLFLPFVDQMIISEVTGDYEGDKYFPE
jgi:dihydrofolate reductase